MGGNKCKACGRISSMYRHLRYFGFPLSNQSQLDKWCEILKVDQSTLNKNSRVCSDHFDDVIGPTQTSSGKFRLKQGAIPIAVMANRTPNKAYSSSSGSNQTAVDSEKTEDDDEDYDDDDESKGYNEEVSKSLAASLKIATSMEPDSSKEIIMGESDIEEIPGQNTKHQNSSQSSNSDETNVQSFKKITTTTVTTACATKCLKRKNESKTGIENKLQKKMNDGDDKPKKPADPVSRYTDYLGDLVRQIPDGVQRRKFQAQTIELANYYIDGFNICLELDVE